MSTQPSPATVPTARLIADKVLSAIERFLHVEAVSGIVLLIAAAAALIWANSPAAYNYHHFWETSVGFSIGGYAASVSLHFLINDALMTIFFLVVGMEIRREMHEGALAQLRVAILPLAAALGGVVVPALIYLSIASGTPALREGWAVPTATDIAFAVGVLALLGRSIPSTVRIFLLALAIIDDIAAVIIIALFYSVGLDYTGLAIAGAGILLVLGLQRIGIGAAYAYVIPGAIVWAGLLKLGVHPTLAGVALGLMTPVSRLGHVSAPLEVASHALGLASARANEHRDPREIAEPLRQLRTAQRDLLPPVSRVQMALHPWVAYLVMPLFALANAGVTLEGTNLGMPAVQALVLGVALALVLGKPIGIVLGSWLAVRLGWCELPAGMSWRSVWLVGCLGGIGFTMSIFIATLAFADLELLAAAKAGVLLGSLTAGIAGLLLGRLYIVRARSVPVATP